MNLEERISAFSALGEILRNSLRGKSNPFTGRMNDLIGNQHLKNPWFTPGNVKLALKNTADELTEENLVKWTATYPALNDTAKPLNVGIIMAGNVPLVGFHDFLSVLITGNSVIAKTSSKDPDLIKLITDILISVNQTFKNRISISEGILSGFDIVIATGSDNSSRYFEHYFGRYPNIIRKNRNSIAVIDGNESDEELEALGSDVFSYFGLGCRSISKLFVPEKYDLSKVTKNWEKYSALINHSKYAANYDFNKAVLLVNKEKFTDTGYLILKEEYILSSPVAVLFYEFYNSQKQLNKYFRDNSDKIQCIVGSNYMPFGKAQSPALWDYADGIDTIDFILKKNFPGRL